MAQHVWDTWLRQLQRLHSPLEESSHLAREKLKNEIVFSTEPSLQGRTKASKPMPMAMSDHHSVVLTLIFGTTFPCGRKVHDVPNTCGCCSRVASQLNWRKQILIRHSACGPWPAVKVEVKEDESCAQSSVRGATARDPLREKYGLLPRHRITHLIWILLSVATD